MKKNEKKQGFTLIELLVVISIIAVLMSIMMPALRKARSQALMVACKSQLKDLSTSMNMYITENSGKLPDSQNVGDNGEIQQGGRWFQKLAHYYNRSTNYQDIVNSKDGTIYDYELYRCPTQERFVKQYKDENNVKSAGAVGIYGYNIFFTNYMNRRKYNWRKFSAIKQPTTLPLLCDISMENPIQDGIEGAAGWRMNVRYPHPNAIVKYGWDGNAQRKEYDYFGPAPNHDGKTNYLFADGHAESLGLWPWQDHIGTDFHPVRNTSINP